MKMNKIIQQNPPNADCTDLLPSRVSSALVWNKSKELVIFLHFSIDLVIGPESAVDYFYRLLIISA